MNVFMNNIVVWALIATGLVLTGGAFAKGTNKNAFLWQGLVAGVVALLVGVVCVYFVQTEEKKTRATIYAIADAFERNDADAVCALLSRDSTKVKPLARSYLENLATVEKTKVTDFQVLEINKTTSPPRARVSIHATASGKARGIDSYPFFVSVDFPMIELRKEQDGVWRVTDNIEYSSPHGN